MPQPIWNTNAGLLGTFPSGIEIIPIQLDADPVLPATSVTYKIISGTLPNGLSMTNSGLINGTPDLVYENANFIFVIRATDNLGNIRDRTFTIGVSGFDSVTFTTPNGTILETIDSVWIELLIEYSVPLPDNSLLVRVVQGNLPPGLEINEYGMIRGYPKPPTIDINIPEIESAIISITNNVLTCSSTDQFIVGRPIVFTDNVFSNIVENTTYYIHSVIDNFNFTISRTNGGDIYQLTDGNGFMNSTLPATVVGQPTIKTYNFTLKLESIYGYNTGSYSITVINQNTPNSQGGPGYIPKSRVPTLLNTRPLTYDIVSNDLDYSFYLLPENSNGNTYNPNDIAYIGEISSDDNFFFQMLGYDFDGNNLEYIFAEMPLGLVGDSTTGWIRGIPIISSDTIEEYSFGVRVRKKERPEIASPYFNFTFKIKNGIDGNISWLTSSNLGTILNGTLSDFSVVAISDVDLKYKLVSGTLPPNLTLLDNGEISGVVAFQPVNYLLNQFDNTTFTFTIAAYNQDIPLVYSEQTFTIDVYQQFSDPFETLYIKCTPSIEDRQLIKSLLENTTLIPDSYLYRKDDIYYGKAKNITYEHMYGVYASSIQEYINAITKNHYWRNITLGQLNTAVARDGTGNIIYEVVYSTVIDNLINSDNISISKEIYWPTLIPLSLGPWYTSVTNIYDNYTNINTSNTPGSARILYPNSLYNMREQIKDIIGQEPTSRILPKWMTSQQVNGSTLGFIQAWVICYTKPGYSEIVKNNIENNWINSAGKLNTLNSINFTIDGFTVDKSTTFNYDNNLSPSAFTNLPSGDIVVDPTDSKDFNVLFPRKTILPDETQY